MKNRVIKLVLLLGLWFTVVVAGASYIGGIFWLFDLVAHFREYYFLMFSLLLAGFLYLRLSWAAYASCIGMVVLGISLVGMSWSLKAQMSGHSDLILFVANIKRENREYQKTIAAIQQQDPDVIVLLEPDQAWIDQMQLFSSLYPYTISEARDDNFGVVLLSKIKLVDARIEKFGLAEVPTVVATLDLGLKKMTVVGTHPYPPFSAENTLFRDDQLLRIAQFIDQEGQPTVLVGDLNATPFSSIYRAMLLETDLINCGQGFGFQRTWQKSPFLPPIPLAIDHCLATPGINIQSFEVGPDINSDHRPLIIRLSVP